MKNMKLRTLSEIQEHNRMTSAQRLKHQYSWDLMSWLQEEHPLLAMLLALTALAGVAAMLVWALLNPYG